MPARLRPLDPARADEALQDWRAGDASDDDRRQLVKHYLALLTQRAPGKSVEVRVPPYAVAQCVEGARHTRGTPPAVVEVDPDTWIALAVGDRPWADAEAEGRLVASGERSDLSPLLPLGR